MAGLSQSEVWATGLFNLDVQTQVIRYNGSGWSDVPLRSTEQSTLMYDIFIRSARDVWFVGWAGAVLHFDGLTVSADATVPTQANLNGIWGLR